MSDGKRQFGHERRASEFNSPEEWDQYLSSLENPEFQRWWAHYREFKLSSWNQVGIFPEIAFAAWEAGRAALERKGEQQP